MQAVMLHPAEGMEKLKNQAQEAGRTHGGFPGTAWSGQDMALLLSAVCLCWW